MLIAHRTATDDIGGIGAAKGTDTEITVTVTVTDNTGLVGNTKEPGTVVVPEAVLGDMTGFRILGILDVVIAEILPGIVVLRLVLVA